ncbi:lipase ZK262.3-like [Mercenaria mercenaria]|uniref:lipase ZK262.3-like n=1 Tax=Mercenaria mercenaria TaxID=6596 RepID=UPI00234E7124|nr:lipase ZK262.3-like [Mercenaria mercenaria]
MDRYILLLTLLLVVPLRCRGSPDCDTFMDCKTCTSHESWIGVCRWCPLDRQCHAHGSLENTCKEDQNIEDPLQCPVDHKAYGVYNPQLAYSSTLLSAIAYTDTPTECMDTIFPDGGFELLYAIGRRCEDFSLFEYEECYAYTAISHKMKMIILAYRGTTTTSGNDQLYDEILSVLTTPKTPFIIGGEVQYYFKQAHDKLFQCVRSSIEEMVRQYPDYDVVITGHSLGGALASLSAASLIYTGVVRENKLSLYTFGMPRVGDKDYAFNHDKIVNNSWRVVHGRDIVAHIPTCNLLLGCRVTADGPYHHRTEIFYRTDPMTVGSTYEQCEGDEDDQCSDGLVTDNWCVTDLGDCIDYHKVYFEIPVGTYCAEKVPRRKRSATEHSLMWDKFSSDQCRRIDISRIDISKEFTDDSASDVEEKAVRPTSDSSPDTRKIQESLLILITFMTLKMVFM